jgi:hypothetical protein
MFATNVLGFGGAGIQMPLAWGNFVTYLNADCVMALINNGIES